MFKLSRRRRKASRKSCSQDFQRRLSLEPLESRQMLAGNIEVSWNDGTVYVKGTEAADTIEVRLKGEQYIFTGGSFTLPAGNTGLPTSYQIREFRIDGLGGNDTILNDTDIPMLIYGGSGEDTITGGHSRDVIDGGIDNDPMLRGRGGNDEIRGGSGNDVLYSDMDGRFTPEQGGSDILIGGEGYDRLDGSIDLDGIWWDNGVLVLQGTDRTDRGDTIVIRQSDGRLYVDGVIRTWANPSVVEVRGGAGSDTIYNDTSIPMTALGGSGNDVITGGHFSDVIEGGDNDDFIRGRGSNDEIRGGGGNDVLYSDMDGRFTPGQGGSDILIGGDGYDRLDGSIDLDGIWWDNGVLVLQGTDRTDRGDTIVIRQNDGRLYVDGVIRTWAYPSVVEVRGGAGNDTIYNDSSISMVASGEEGFDTMTGGPGNDTFRCDSDQFIQGRGGEDVLVMQGTANGDRIIFRELGQVRWAGNRPQVDVQVESRDRFWNATGIEYLRAEGGNGGDYLYNDTILPSELNGGEGRDILTGGAGNDTFITDSDELVRGREGSDRLVVIGATGRDEIFFRPRSGEVEVESLGQRWNATGIEQLEARGGGGHDLLVNETNVPSQLFGEGGNDTLLGGAGNDEFFGGDGIDTVSYERATQGVTVYLFDRWATGQGRDSLIDIENIFGSQHNDWLEGNSMANLIEGRGGDDTIIGHDGHDTLDGGSGNDSLLGGTGNDTIYGRDDNDKLYGGDGDDRLEGGIGHDILHGEAGNDLLFGLEGTDRLYGGDGNDRLDGGMDPDLLEDVRGNNAFLDTDPPLRPAADHLLPNSRPTVPGFREGRPETELGFLNNSNFTIRAWIEIKKVSTVLENGKQQVTITTMKVEHLMKPGETKWLTSDPDGSENEVTMKVLSASFE